MGQGAVVFAGNVIGVTVQGNGVIGRYLGTETDRALSKSRAVIKDGALHPVDTAWRCFLDAMILVGKAVFVALEFIGIPVSRTAAQRLVFYEALGFALATGAGFNFGGNERLTDIFSMSHRRKATDGQR